MAAYRYIAKSRHNHPVAGEIGAGQIDVADWDGFTHRIEHFGDERAAALDFLRRTAEGYRGGYPLVLCGGPGGWWIEKGDDPSLMVGVGEPDESGDFDDYRYAVERHRNAVAAA